MRRLALLIALLVVVPDAQAEAVRVAGGLWKQGERAGWRGLVPASSKLADVVAALGEPAAREADGALTKLTYGPNPDLKFNAIWIDAAGVVRKIAWSRFEERDRVRMPEIVAALGAPEKLSDHSFLGQGQIYRYRGQSGLWGVMDARTGNVMTLVLYDPADPPKIPVPKQPLKE